MMKWFLVFSLAFAGAEVVDLSVYEKSSYSQNGEDGVLKKIFELIGTGSKYCVEFGAFDGITASNTYSFRAQGWDCVLFDASFENPLISLYREFVTRENINALFDKYAVPTDLDLISIDIDCNDFHVWMALDPKFEAKVVVIECNASHPPEEDKVVPYRPLSFWDETNYFGASVQAIYNLGRSKGYSLIYHESTGANLFFIKDSVLKEKDLHFKNINDVQRLYKKPTYGDPRNPNGGHPQDLQNRPYQTSEEILENFSS